MAAGVSRALVHTYLGDRRGLLDAVQVRIVSRMDAWVGHGLSRATDPVDRLRAILGGLFAFVEAEREAWGVLVASGGLDHPALHGVRGRWAAALADDDEAGAVAAQAVVAAALLGVGGWVNRGVEPGDVLAPLRRALDA
jgi:AcrR family transcriptional regulator